jgi:hypothetical protein
MAIFTSSERWQEARIRALALYCSDGRWGEAFDEFCHKYLMLPRYDRWAVPGGPAWLATDKGRADFGQGAHEQFDFLVKAHDLRRVVLITHYGCAAYGKWLGQPPDGCLTAQLGDVRAAARTLRSWYPDMRVEGYLAMRREQSLTFHELGAWGEC